MPRASACGATATAKPRCRSARNLRSGKTLTSSLGYSLNYNTLDNNQNPTNGLLVDFAQDFAGVGGDVSYLKTAVDAKYYTPLVSDIVGIDPSAGRHPEQARQQRPAHARSLPDGSEPRSRLRAERHRSARHQSVRHAWDALGGTKYWGASFELQMPFWFLPKEVGLKGAVYADAGGLYDYKGPTTWS